MLLLMAALAMTASTPRSDAAPFNYVALGDSLGAGMGAKRG